MNTRSKGVIVAIAGVVIIAMIGAVIATGVITQTMLTIFAGAGEEYGADQCVDGRVLLNDGAGKRYKSPEELARTIYTQATGLGVGELGAVAAIATAMVETGGGTTIKNGTVGDTIQSLTYFPGAAIGDMSDSRGIFQQRQSWAPKGTAWSGLKFTYADSRRVFSDRNPDDVNRKAAMNPWRITKWAVGDPRMHPAHATNMFVLGGAGNSSEGLERVLMKNRVLSKRGAPLKSLDADAYTDQQIQDFAADVQHGVETNFPKAIPIAREWVKTIQDEQATSPLPAFVPPLPDMSAKAQTGVVKTALKRHTGTDTQGAAIVGDGITFIGDSIMQGVLTSQRNLPDTLYGGPVRQHYARGINLRTVLEANDYRINGSKDPQGRRVTPLNEWRDAIATGPSRIVVALGTNGGGTADDVDRFMALAGPDRQVYWYTTLYEPVSGFNDVLQRARARHPNLVIVDVTDIAPIRGQAHPWDGARPSEVASLQNAMFNRAADYITTSRTPQALQSLACGGESVYVGNIAAPSPEAAEAVMWALSKARAGAKYVAGANAGNTSALAFDCSTFTYTAYRQAGLDWRMQTSSNQWADKTRVQLIPISQAQPGDLIFQNWGGGDGLAAGHVGIVVSMEGDGQFVHASNPERGVVVDPIKVNASHNGRGVWMAPKDPNVRTNSASDVTYSSNWEDAWVGRIIADDTPNTVTAAATGATPAGR